MTLYLNINEPTNVAVTLAGASISPNPSYIWNIIDQETFLNYTFCADNTSPDINSYSSFTFSVVVGATAGATAGIISAQQGQYTYYVYETQYPYNLNLNMATDIVDIGALRILGTPSNPMVSFTQSTTYVVFKN